MPGPTGLSGHAGPRRMGRGPAASPPEAPVAGTEPRSTGGAPGLSPRASCHAGDVVMQPSTFRNDPAGRPPHSPAFPASLLAVIVALTAVAGLSAKDWPQWRGEERRGVWTETGILEAFPRYGAHREVAGPRQRRLRRPRRGRRPRLRARLCRDRAADHGRHRAAARARRGDRRGALVARVDHHLPDAHVHLRHRPPRHPHRRRRPGLRDGVDRAHPVPGGGDGGRRLGEGHRRRVRHQHPHLGHVQRAAHRRRPRDLPGGRRARRPGDGVRQAHRRRGVAGPRDPDGDGLQPAPDHRGGRGAPAHRLASPRPLLARPPRPARSTGRSRSRGGPT